MDILKGEVALGWPLGHVNCLWLFRTQTENTD